MRQTFWIIRTGKDKGAVMSQAELIALLKEGELQDGTELHKGYRTNVSYVISDYGSTVRTWKGRVILKGE
jgi:hypothetical protein